MATFQFRPLRWDQPETDPRSTGARFRAAWSDTIELLKREVEMLGGEAIALQVDATEDQIRRDGMLRSTARPAHPGVKLSFTSVHGPLTYVTDQYDHWKANVRAIALGLQALRAVDRYGISKRGEQYTGWTALSDKPFGHEAGEMTRREAAAVLANSSGTGISIDSLLSDATKVTETYRAAARRWHPDRGGNAETFQLIVQARRILLGRP